MKKIVFLLILCFILCSCSTANKQSDDKISVVCTVFPAYDWVRNIIGDIKNTEVTLIPSNGTDIHSYQPTTDDIIKINECDLYICSEGVGKNMHSAIVDTKFHFINLGEEYTDEHMWFSPEKAMLAVERIAGRLSQINPENAQIYRKNKEKYLDELKKLDEEYEDAVNSSEKNTIVVADRFPFRHLTESYGINYYAAFEGCSAESEISFETVLHLKKHIEEEGLSCMIVTESPNEGILKSIINETENIKVLTLDSMQSVTEEELEKTDYLSVMRNNLSVLKEALG